MERKNDKSMVKDVMTRDVKCVYPETTLQEAAEKMRVFDIGSIPVCEGDRFIGMLTDRDITVRATAEGRDPKTTKVREVMTPEAVFCTDDQDIHECAQLMEKKQIRRLPVLNRQKQIVGILSLGDLAVHDGGDEKLAGEVLEEVSKPKPAGIVAAGGGN